MKKYTKRLLSLLLILALSFSFIPLDSIFAEGKAVAEFQNTAQEKPVTTPSRVNELDENSDFNNLALNKSATASDYETDDFAADKAFDGIINRDEPNASLQSRWASAVNSDQHWLQVDLGSVKEIRTFIINWERRNVQDYQILVSKNGTDFTTAIHKTEKPDRLEERIVLDEPVKARYVKLQIDEFDSVADGVDF